MTPQPNTKQEEIDIDSEAESLLDDLSGSEGKPYVEKSIVLDFLSSLVERVKIAERAKVLDEISEDIVPIFTIRKGATPNG